MALTPDMVKPVSPDPFIKDDEDMMLIKLGHYKVLAEAVVTAQTAADNAQSTADNNTLPYTSYVAILNQSSTSAPSVTVVYNNLPGTPTWGRTGTGNYTATLTGAFTSGKTVVFLTGTGISILLAGAINADAIAVKSYSDAGVITDSLLQTTSIEIRVYN